MDVTNVRVGVVCSAPVAVPRGVMSSVQTVTDHVMSPRDADAATATAAAAAAGDDVVHIAISTLPRRE